MKTNADEMVSTARKECPIYSGVIQYFPLALKEIAKVSYQGSKQHHPDKPLHWDREKSKDQLDALMRHLTDHASGEILDTDGMLHLSKVCWRAMAELELLLEKHPKEYFTLTEKEKEFLEDNLVRLKNN